MRKSVKVYLPEQCNGGINEMFNDTKEAQNFVYKNVPSHLYDKVTITEVVIEDTIDDILIKLNDTIDKTRENLRLIIDDIKREADKFNTN